MTSRRRDLLLALGALALAPRSAGAETLARTVRMFPGPFYPDTIPLDHDADLTAVAGQAGTARGTVAELTGRVLDERGRAIAGAQVEIWQCDAGGRYHHVGGDDAALDPGFQGYGRVETDAQGRYRFRTIRPVKYGGRCPHIHMKVRGAGVEDLTTQLFVQDDPANTDDFVWRSLDPAERELLSAAFVPGVDGRLAAHFDLILGVAPSGI